MSRLRTAVEAHTGLAFGVGRQQVMPPGTSLGEPIFYLRVGTGRDGLVPFEVGNSRRFLFVARIAAPEAGDQP